MSKNMAHTKNVGLSQCTFAFKKNLPSNKTNRDFRLYLFLKYNEIFLGLCTDVVPGICKKSL